MALMHRNLAFLRRRMVTEVSPEQLENADSPIEVTELGIVTDISLEQAKNAYLGIIVTCSPIVKDVRFVQPLNTEL